MSLCNGRPCMYLMENSKRNSLSKKSQRPLNFFQKFRSPSLNDLIILPWVFSESPQASAEQCWVTLCIILNRDSELTERVYCSVLFYKYTWVVLSSITIFKDIINYKTHIIIRIHAHLGYPLYKSKRIFHSGISI